MKIDRMERISIVAVGLVTASAVVLGTGINSLSVLVGGVIGLANLRLWRGIVRGLIARQMLSRSGLAGRFLLKLCLLGGFVLVVVRSGLAPWGVMIGFGSVLGGMLWASCFGSETDGTRVRMD